MYCRKCDEHYSDDLNFCPNCGSKLLHNKPLNKHKGLSPSQIVIIVLLSLILICILFLGSIFVSTTLFDHGSPSTTPVTDISDDISDTQLSIGNSLSQSEYMREASSVNYSEVSRNPHGFSKSIIRFTGCVENITETDFTLTFRLNVTKTAEGWDNGIYVDYEKIYSNEEPIFAGDIVTVYGEIFNNDKYEDDILPYMIAKYIEPEAKHTPLQPIPDTDVNDILYDNSPLYTLDSTLLSLRDLANLNREQVALLRNEIYARHGYIFTNSTYYEYFSNQAWYVPNPNFSEDMLNEFEKKNKLFIVEYEKEHGWR